MHGSVSVGSLPWNIQEAYTDDLRVGNVGSVTVARRIGEVSTFPSDDATSASTICKDDVLEPPKSRGSKLTQFRLSR